MKVDFEKYRTAVEVKPPTWRSCIRIIATKSFPYYSLLPLLAASLYIEKRFKDRTQTVNDVTKFVEEIRDSFIEMINAVDWMNDDTKDIAIKKAQNIKNMIGYPEKLLETNDLYPNLEIGHGQVILNGDFFHNTLRIRKYNVDSVDSVDTSRFNFVN